MSRTINVNEQPVRFSEFRISNYQKAGTKTLMMRQSLTTTYTYSGSSDGSNSLQQNPFADSIPETEIEEHIKESNRVCFLSVGDSMTEEEVVGAIKPSWRIQRTWANRPILSTEQEFMIKEGKLSYDDIAEKQLVVDPDNGSPILDSFSKHQYFRDNLNLHGEEDVDLRGNSEEYIPTAFKMEADTGIVPDTLLT